MSTWHRKQVKSLKTPSQPVWLHRAEGLQTLWTNERNGDQYQNDDNMAAVLIAADVSKAFSRN